jgi:Undecaprenyl-phosphate galactose phosphotransferase WbaP
MSVVNRLPRAFAFDADSGSASFRAASASQPAGRSQDGSRLHSPSGAACALGLIGADTIAFTATLCLAVAVMAVIPAELAERLGGGDVGVIAAPVLWAICSYAGLTAYFAAHGHYDHRCDLWTEAREIATGSAIAMVVTGWVAFMLGQPMPRLLIVLAALMLPVLVLSLRQVAKGGLHRAGVWSVPVVVVGSGTWLGVASDALKTAKRLGYDVVGQVGSNSVLGTATARPWESLLSQHGARMVVLAFDPDHRAPAGFTASLVRERVPFAVMPHLDGLPVAGCKQTTLVTQEAILQQYKNNLDKPVARATKIAFDLIASSLALVVLAPVLVVIAAAVSLDGGSVLYGHKRIGAGGRVFKCLKFRSMVVNGDDVLRQLLAEDPDAADEWTRTQKLRNDPRVTWIGRILRKTSLDELPQLLNVIQLDMSLVGPRPIVSLEIPKYAEDITYYYETRPGITGLWQVSGRSDTTYAQRVRLDSWYVKNWTIWQDLAILFKTIPAVISGRGAG